MTSLSPPTIPPALKRGDTIAFISPSARLNDLYPSLLARGISFFESKGYNVKSIYSPIPPNTNRGQHVANEIHIAFQDPTINCVISNIGGTEANECLRYINYDLIRDNPKIFVGYSDITFLVYAFYVKAGLRTFYGPCTLTEFAESPEPDSFTVEHFFKVLSAGQGEIFGKQVPYSKEFTHDELTFFTEAQGGDTKEVRTKIATPKPFFLRNGRAEGPIFGGCLRKLNSLGGTPYLPSTLHAGAILFMEISQGENDTAMPLYRVRSDLFDLLNKGLFDGIVGLVMGRTYRYDEKMNLDLYRVVEELLDGLEGGKVPVLVGVDIGHTSPMMTVPFGTKARIDSELGEFCFLEEGVVRN